MLLIGKGIFPMQQQFKSSPELGFFTNENINAAYQNSLQEVSYLTKRHNDLVVQKAMESEATILPGAVSLYCCNS